MTILPRLTLLAGAEWAMTGINRMPESLQPGPLQVKGGMPDVPAAQWTIPHETAAPLKR